MSQIFTRSFSRQWLCIYVINGIHQNSDGNLIATSWNCFTQRYSQVITFFDSYFDFYWYIKKLICVFSIFQSITGWSGLTLKHFGIFRTQKHHFFLDIRRLESANILTEIANQQHGCSRMQFVLTFKLSLKQLSQFSKIIEHIF